MGHIQGKKVVELFLETQKLHCWFWSMGKTNNGIY